MHMGFRILLSLFCLAVIFLSEYYKRKVEDDRKYRLAAMLSVIIFLVGNVMPSLVTPTPTNGVFVPDKTFKPLETPTKFESVYDIPTSLSLPARVCDFVIGDYGLLVLYANGTVEYIPIMRYEIAQAIYQEVATWKNVIGIAGDGVRFFARFADGSCKGVGASLFGEAYTSYYSDIRQIFSHEHQTLIVDGVGRVHTVGSDGNIRDALARWTDIKQVSGIRDVYFGLHRGGTLVSNVSDRFIGDAMAWIDVAYISATPYFLLGVKRDGSVKMNIFETNFDEIYYDDPDGKTRSMLENAQPIIEGWENVVEIVSSCDSSGCLIIGVQADGKILYYNSYPSHYQLQYITALKEKVLTQKPLSSWENILKIEVRYTSAIGLTSNGDLLVTDSSQDLL